MKYFIRVEFEEGHSQHSCPYNTTPRYHFDECVKQAKGRGYTSIELLRTHCGSERIIKRWRASDEVQTHERMPAPYKYKVHSARAPLGTATPASSNKYYDTPEEAEAAAKKCVEKWSEKHEGCIIYKAVKFVRRETPPIVIEDIE